MKNKPENWNINSQEDEDGFNINPYNVFIFESTNENQDLYSIRKNTNTATGSAEFISNTTIAKQNVNERSNFPNHITTSRKSNSLHFD